MAQPKAFYSYMENENKLNMLSDEQAGRLYKSLYAYSRTGEKPDFSDDPLLAYAFEDFIIDIDRDRERYDKTCERRSEAGKKGGKASGESRKQNEANEANAYFASQNEAKGSKRSEPEAEAEAEAEYISSEILNTRTHTEEDFDVRCQKILDLFAEICTSFPRPGKLTERRRQMIYDADLEGVDYDALFKAAQSSKFLSTTQGIGFDWIMKPDNREKILEGNYKSERKPPGRGSCYTADGGSFDMDDYKSKELFNG